MAHSRVAALVAAPRQKVSSPPLRRRRDSKPRGRTDLGFRLRPLAPMADANAAVPAMPPPRPAWRSIAAAVVRSRRAAAATAVVAAVYLVLAMLWCLCASLGLRRIARAACGEGCVLVAGADEVLRFVTVSLVVVAIVTLAVAVASICVVVCDPDAEKVIN